jgi:hypothetical protein
MQNASRLTRDPLFWSNKSAVEPILFDTVYYAILVNYSKSGTLDFLFSKPIDGTTITRKLPHMIRNLVGRQSQFAPSTVATGGALV